MNAHISDDLKATFVSKIIKWYKQYGRHNLPWRISRNPWHILVAAYLLRKTATKQVERIYSKFINKYPSPESVLRADINELKEIIRPLGIEHKRSELLKRACEVIVKEFNGQIPNTLKDLKKIPGVGDYIAREVLCIAYRQPEPLLDRNMIRVLERVFGVKSRRSRPHTDKDLWQFAKSLVPEDPDLAREFNYGVLDFAQAVCRARSPKCNDCPLKSICRAHQSNL